MFEFIRPQVFPTPEAPAEVPNWPSRLGRLWIPLTPNSPVVVRTIHKTKGIIWMETLTPPVFPRPVCK